MRLTPYRNTLLESPEVMATKDDIFRGALNLPPEDRAELAHRLLSSLDDDADVPEDVAAEAWDAELERRTRDVAEGRVRAIPAAEARQEVEALLARLRSGRG